MIYRTSTRKWHLTNACTEKHRKTPKMEFSCKREFCRNRVETVLVSNHTFSPEESGDWCSVWCAFRTIWMCSAKSASFDDSVSPICSSLWGHVRHGFFRKEFTLSAPPWVTPGSNGLHSTVRYNFTILSTFQRQPVKTKRSVTKRWLIECNLTGHQLTQPWI